MLAKLASLIRNFARKRRRDEELDAEVRGYAEMLAEEKMRDGMKPDEARRAARIELGGVEQVKEQVREVRAGAWLDCLLQDVRYGARMLRRNPGFTAVAIVTLALGIGVNTAMFTIVNGFLLRPLPVHDAAQITAIPVEEKGFPIGARGFSYPEFADLRQQASPVVDVFANVLGQPELSVDDKANSITISYVSSNCFTALGLKPAAGRLILPDEAERSGTQPVIVLGYAYWQSRFGGAPVIGKQVLINGRSATIVGVAPKEFHGMFASFQMDAYLPISALEIEVSNRLWTSRDLRRLLVFGRLRDGVSIPQAQSAIDVIGERLAHQYPATDGTISFRIIPERFARPIPYANNFFVTAGAIFLGLAAFVFLLACINVENLLLTRSMSRQREMGVRSALGAGRGRLIRQMVTESSLLALLGGVAGAAVGLLANRVVGSIRLHNFPLQLDTTFDWRIFAYALASALLAGVAVSLFPAFRVSRTDVNAVLAHRQSEADPFSNVLRGRNLLVVAQIAGSMTLLIVAALLVRSLREAHNTSLGFDAGHILNATFDPSHSAYDRTRTIDFYRQLESRVAALPGVESATLASNPPMTGFPCKSDVFAQGHPIPPGESAPNVLCNGVDPSYFATLQISLLLGRDFTPSDDESATRVAIVNQTMARQFWPHESPIGKQFRQSPSGPLIQVIGVAANAKYLTIAEDPQPCLYLPLTQDFAARRTLLVRTFAAPESFAGAIKQEIGALAPGLPILNLETMQQALDGAFGFFTFRLAAALAAVMGGVGFVLAVIGVYGVVSFSLAQRTREFGVRMALGAEPMDILRLVLRQGLTLAAGGALLGFIATRALSGTVAHLLLGVSATDSATYAAAGLLLSAIVLLACYVPARRAMRADPMIALRHE
jgi:macrolide transport system ATP-binding/permease protein